MCGPWISKACRVSRACPAFFLSRFLSFFTCPPSLSQSPLSLFIRGPPLDVLSASDMKVFLVFFPPLLGLLRSKIDWTKKTIYEGDLWWSSKCESLRVEWEKISLSFFLLQKLPSPLGAAKEKKGLCRNQKRLSSYEIFIRGLSRRDF